MLVVRDLWRQCDTSVTRANECESRLKDIDQRYTRDPRHKKVERDEAISDPRASPRAGSRSTKGPRAMCPSRRDVKVESRRTHALYLGSLPKRHLAGNIREGRSLFRYPSPPSDLRGLSNIGNRRKVPPPPRHPWRRWNDSTPHPALKNRAFKVRARSAIPGLDP